MNGAEEILASPWSDRGGIRGAMRGTHSLGYSYWMIGIVMPAGLLFLSFIVAKLIPHSYSDKVMFLGFAMVALMRVVSWYCVFKCRRNTVHGAYKGLALMSVITDVNLGFIKWPILWFMVAR